LGNYLGIGRRPVVQTFIGPCLFIIVAGGLLIYYEYHFLYGFVKELRRK